MKLDTLGAVSNAHLSLADQLGPEHPDCLELCELHSTAVDCTLQHIKPCLPILLVLLSLSQLLKVLSSFQRLKPLTLIPLLPQQLEYPPSFLESSDQINGRTSWARGCWCASTFFASAIKPLTVHLLVKGNIYESKKPLGVMFRHPQLNPFPPLEPVIQTFLDSRLAKIPVPLIVLEMAIRLKGAFFWLVITDDLNWRGRVRVLTRSGVQARTTSRCTR